MCRGGLGVHSSEHQEGREVGRGSARDRMDGENVIAKVVLAAYCSHPTYNTYFRSTSTCIYFVYF